MKDQSFPLYEESVAAGFPSPAEGERERELYPFQLENGLYNERTPRDSTIGKGSCIRDTGPFPIVESREGLFVRGKSSFCSSLRRLCSH